MDKGGARFSNNDNKTLIFDIYVLLCYMNIFYKHHIFYLQF